jgi:hypothetical protein
MQRFRIPIGEDLILKGHQAAQAGIDQGSGNRTTGTTQQGGHLGINLDGHAGQSVAFSTNLP